MRAAREAGACGVWANVLHLKPGTREHFLDCLARDWPELLPEYERLYGAARTCPNAEAAPIRDARAPSSRASTASATAGACGSRRRPSPEQLTLIPL